MLNTSNSSLRRRIYISYAKFYCYVSIRRARKKKTLGVTYITRKGGNRLQCKKAAFGNMQTQRIYYAHLGTDAERKCIKFVRVYTYFNVLTIRSIITTYARTIHFGAPTKNYFRILNTVQVPTYEYITIRKVFRYEARACICNNTYTIRSVSFGFLAKRARRTDVRYAPRT